jgi:hypothetical protein
MRKNTSSLRSVRESKVHGPLAVVQEPKALRKVVVFTRGER